MTINRRTFIQTAAALSAASALPLIARASTPVEKNSPAVAALKYVEEASNAERADKMGFKGEDQICSNCRFYAKTDESWGGCVLFQNRLVKGRGWCTGWVPTT